ncbi:MAG: hypothetical protein ACHREM_27550, partial [Polyangiales bacterium]
MSAAAKKADVRGVVAAPVKRSFHDEEQLGKAVDLELMRRLWPFVKPHSHVLILSMLMLPLGAWIVTLRPTVMKNALDQAVATHDVSIIDRAGLV